MAYFREAQGSVRAERSGVKKADSRGAAFASPSASRRAIAPGHREDNSLMA